MFLNLKGTLKFSTIQGSRNFSNNRLYLCIKTPTEFKEYLNTLAWEQRVDYPKLNLFSGLVYCAKKNENGLWALCTHGPHGLDFSESFEFIEQPEEVRFCIEQNINP